MYGSPWLDMRVVLVRSAALIARLKKLCPGCKAHFCKHPKILFQYIPMVLRTITVSILFSPTEKYCFFLNSPGDWQCSTTLTSSKRTQKSQYPVCSRGPHGTANAQRFFFFLLVGQVPSCSCAVASVVWESCPATRSPSCGCLHRQTVETRFEMFVKKAL